jgi:hypothetical protein
MNDMFRDSKIRISDFGVALVIAALALITGKAAAAAWRNARKVRSLN